MVMKPARSPARQLALVSALIGGSTVLAVGGVAAAIGAGPGQLAVMIGVSAVIFTFAVWYASKRLVSDSILNLAETVAGVSASHDYATRVEGESRGDEVGRLADKLNELLRGIEEQARNVQEEHERNLRGERSRMEAEIVARTRALRASNEELQAAAAQAKAAEDAAVAWNETRNQNIAEMTHELRTPMNGVMGMAELLLNTDLNPKQLGYTRTVLESSEDLLSLVNNILDFSKIEAGQLDRVDSQPLSPRDCVEKVSQLLIARAEMKGLSLSIECAENVPTAILGDGKRLRQVLINTIGNAIKFTERGTIAVRTSLVEQVGDVSTIRVEVVDTGIGVPDHLHEHVFEQFSQADRSTTRQFGGAGLDLTISKHLLELMGGEIGLISRPGVGSNFWFTIKGEHRRPVTAADRDLGGIHALIVGTAGAGRDALRKGLTSCDAASAEVPSAGEALAALQAGAFDVIVIDTQSQDGLSLARDIRASEAPKSLPLLLVSNVERPRSELEEIGIDGSLMRPVEQKELFTRVAGLVGRLDVVLRPEDREAEGPDAREEVAGARILVAEDHPVNREITMTLVETLKCVGDIAVDGAEAVEAVQREAYDVILLDCQMPKLDGYEAARQIRDLEQQGRVKSRGSSERLGHVPIVALTAHTSPTDQARCLESGMDDFVRKPFTLRVLRGVIGKWVAGRVEPSATPASPMAADPSTPVSDDAPISEAAIEQILELDRLNGGGVFARFAHGFLEAVPTTLEQLRTAVREHDAAGIARSAHALHGASLNLGAEPMAAASRELEALVENGSTEGASSLAAQIDDLYLAVKAALEARLDLEKDHHDDVVTA